MRLSIDSYLMGLAQIAARRTTCVRRGVGCVLADARGHVLSIGYNGVAAGLPHCNEGSACCGAELPPGFDQCEAVHAEQNALLQCYDMRSIKTAYVTLSPCRPCTKLLLNTPCKRVVFLEEHTDSSARNLWVTKACRKWDNLIY